LREYIQLHFEKLLAKEEAASVVSSVYSACAGLDYIQESDVEDGLKHCYAIPDSEPLRDAIERLSE